MLKQFLQHPPGGNDSLAGVAVEEHLFGIAEFVGVVHGQPLA